VVDLVLDGVVLAYDDAGSGEPPLVFVHGAACNRRFWSQQVPRFSSAHRVVAVDLRGHGESDAPSERYTVRLFSEDLASTCTQLGIECPVGIGHSLGGLVALDFASAYPAQVGAAVLIDSPLLPGGDRAEVCVIWWPGSAGVIRTRPFAPTLRVCSLVAMTVLVPGRGSSITSC
jgi:pimeloyl-ACP methyl ester carboxylesterase